MKKKVVGIIGTNGLPGKYGGWDQLVLHLTSKLNTEFDFVVYTSYTNYDPSYPIIKGVLIKKMFLKANGIQSVLYDILSIVHALRYCDVLLICGTSGCVSLPFVRLFEKKIILNPDGQEWKRGKWNKFIQVFLKFSEKIGVYYSDAIVSDNKVIKEYIFEEYNRGSILIEYGGDHARSIPIRSETERKYDIVKREYAFKVCRIVPENNIDMILEAFSETPEIDLVIIGNWRFSEYGLALYNSYSRFENIKLLMPIYDQEILDEFRSNCKVYIHGHSVGGTNPSLVEAMNLGLCVFAFDVNYNRETTGNQARYFKDKYELLSLLKDVSADEMNKVSAEMKSIADKRYTWTLITTKYADVFRN